MKTVAASEEISSKAPALCSQRWNLSVLCMFGLLMVYVVRVNLSVAIICMVRAPRVNVTSGQAAKQKTTFLDESGFSTGPSADFQDERSVFPTTSGDMNGSYDGTDSGITDEDDIAANDCSLQLTSPTSSSDDGELDWDKGTQSRLLSMYFYGYIFTQIPGGWLAGRYGGRRVWGICQGICALCTLATPLAARVNVYLMYACRFVLGLAAGVSFPCVHAMMGRWAPKLERSKLVAFSFTGVSFGAVLTFSLSALLCVYGFDNGWGSIFYLSGVGNLLWVAAWFALTADTPAKHKRISEAERNYIQKSIGERQDEEEKLPTPWRAIFTSKPVWGMLVAHVCTTYTGYTLLTSLPTFMKEVLKFDIKQNGALSALPYVCQIFVSIATGQVADMLREIGILSTKNTRKLFQTLAFVGSALCMGTVGYMTCDQRYVAVFLVCLSQVFQCLCRVGYAVNHIDLAPRYAGVLFGITNTVATIPGMVGPLIVGALTPNKTAEEWRYVFFLCSAMSIVGAIVFGVFADGELQSWAAPPAVEFFVEFHKEKEDGCEATAGSNGSPGEVTSKITKEISSSTVKCRKQDPV